MASLLGRFLGTISGGKELKVSEQLLFDKVIGFRGVTEGVGATTLVFNTAVALADTTNMNICVVDTHVLYPVLNQYLGGAAALAQGKDWFDFVAESDNLNDIAYATNIKNVYLVSFHNRGIADMFTSLDNEKVVTTMFDTLTKFFDIVLVDISHEPTYISSISATKCNKIYTVFESSLGCLSSLKDSINNVVNLGVPPYKLNKVIENKHISDVNTGIQNVLNAYHFKLIASIPFSVDIARPCVLGKRIWGMASNKVAITEFNKAIDVLLDDVLQTNNQIQGYIKNEEERTDVEMGQPPLRVDKEPFEYEEIEGSAKPLTRHRPEDVVQRGVGINDTGMPPQQQSIVVLKQFGNGQTDNSNIQNMQGTAQGMPNGMMTGVPDSGMMSGMPNNGVMMGVPDNGMMSGVPNNSVMTGVPDNGMMSGVPNNSVMAGVPDNGMMSGMPNNGMMGVPDNAMQSNGLTGMPDNGMSNNGMMGVSDNPFGAMQGNMMNNGVRTDNMSNNGMTGVPDNPFGVMQNNMVNNNEFQGMSQNNVGAFGNMQGTMQNQNNVVNPFAAMSNANNDNSSFGPQGSTQNPFQAMNPFQQ